MPELTDLTGVGSATASKLSDHGIEDVDGLAEADPSDIDDLGEGKAKKIIRRAQQELIQSQTAAELLEEFEDQEFVSTGINTVDEILGGGWEPETTGLIYGQSGTAKTQILFSSLGEASSEGSAVYLMTETQSKSIADRLKDLSSSVENLEDIHIYQAHDVDEQREAYTKIAEDFDEIELLVIDSFTAQFRMTSRFDGRENYGERSAEMGKHLRRTGKMSRVFQCPVVMTGQVYESPDMYGKKDELYGGQKMEHFISYFIRMSEGSGTLKEASLENHPGIEESTVELRIGSESIEEA